MKLMNNIKILYNSIIISWKIYALIIMAWFIFIIFLMYIDVKHDYENLLLKYNENQEIDFSEFSDLAFSLTSRMKIDARLYPAK